MSRPSIRQIEFPSFGTADNYYRLASSGRLLRDIRVPKLVVQSVGDPLIPLAAFRTTGIEKSPFLRLLATEYGGHSGFLGRRPVCSSDTDNFWAECRVVQFLSSLQG